MRIKKIIIISALMLLIPIVAYGGLWSDFKNWLFEETLLEETQIEEPEMGATICYVYQGCTGIGSYNRGDLIMATSTSALTVIATGTDAYVLTMSSGIPAWAISTAGVGGLWTSSTGFTYLTATTSDLIIGKSATTTTPFWFDVDVSQFHLHSHNTADPGMHFKTFSTTTPNEIWLTLDESGVNNILNINGQTASVDTYFNIHAKDGEQARIGLYSGATNKSYINVGAADHLSIVNAVADANMVFGIEDATTSKTITWDADVDKLKHSAGLFNFDDDHLLTTGDLTAASGTFSGLFDVTDYVHFDDTDLSTYIGYQAGANRESTSDYNMALGYQAMAGAMNSADWNVAIGYRALYSNTSGNENFALGSQAMLDNTTGAYNIAIGAAALYENIDGSRNIAIGKNAILVATTSDKNVAIGAYALDAHIGTGDSHNVAIGYEALTDDTTGLYNVGIGGLALHENKGGHRNIGIGWASGHYQEESDKNVFIGHEAGKGSGAADYGNNVAIGYRAGYVLHDGGNNNVLLGYQIADNLTIGSDNIVIGYDINTPATSTSDYLNIGDAITGDLSTGDITIANDFTVTGGTTLNTAWTGLIRADSGVLSTTTDADTQLSQAEVEDFAGGIWTGNTETLIALDYQTGDNTMDAVVDPDLHKYSWTNVVDSDITNTLTASIVSDADKGDVNISSGVWTVEDLTITSEDEGDLLYFDGTNWVRLATSTDGYVLTLVSNIPAWAAGGAGDVLSVGDCAAGVCLDGTSDGGTNITFYNIDSNKTQLIASDVASDLVVTLPATSGTLVHSGVATLSSLTSIGTIGTGVWEGTAVSSTFGGTNLDTSGWTGITRIDSGVWSTTSIDISDDTNLAFGRSITGSGDSIEADAELYTESFSIPIRNATTSENGWIQHTLPNTITITEISCFSNTSTFDIQLDERASSTPTVAGTDIMGSALQCVTSTTATTSFSNAGIAAYAKINLDIDAVGTSGVDGAIHIHYTIND